jgi:predicted nucleic acid-binding protein
MRDLFPGHYQPTPEDFERIWTEGLFVFDTNVLLDIFRYSQETAEQPLSTLEKLRDRVWLPYQAATEYHRKLEKVINDQQKPYDDAIGQLKALLTSFRETRRHPFLESSLAEEATELFGRLQASLSASKGRIGGLLNANPTKERLAAILVAAWARPSAQRNSLRSTKRGRSDTRRSRRQGSGTRTSQSLSGMVTWCCGRRF